MIPEDTLNRWQALYDDTTPGPWRVRCTGVQMDSTCSHWHVESASVREWPDYRIFPPMSQPYRVDNARFAVAAHEAFPALIAEVRRYQHLVRDIQTVLDNADSVVPVEDQIRDLLKETEEPDE
ncbi:hypothetical protein SAMN00768000_3610 [Sulfobacillus thermosulfidooxidans DSM 9293]|uniref:Uncharacterized protein n=1 Tax=Sulfobacillus thermosulfidooxidans (strain DSM 9293 / VKM B-1269 / AT-1) TaxID=929705 RepID=A0A1W1WPA6_SULTA|nr:hypothetical protein [Sulfobacillus thermosulfidooxidans]SMC08039.1 hypothetical protein SAMN00768000_3610 [Sulfobacillus thermosulfidooxidans DSM 9293]